MKAGQVHCQIILEYVQSERAILEAQQQLERERQLELSPARRALMDAKQAIHTDKWTVIDVEQSKVTEGFVYLLSNPLMPGVYKIGFTAGNPDKRAREITTQYKLPTPFEVVSYWRTKDPYIVEQRIHESLLNYGKAGEFFEVDLELAKATIENQLVK